MDSARCLCLLDTNGVRVTTSSICPIHGGSSRDPGVSYVLTYQDRIMLRTMRIDPGDDAERARQIQDVRQSEERRFHRG